MKSGTNGAEITTCRNKASLLASATTTSVLSLNKTETSLKTDTFFNEKYTDM